MDWGFFKRHKWISVGLIVFGLFLVWLLSRGSGNTATASTGGITQQQAALAMAQLQSQTQLAAVHEQTQGQIDLATIVAGLETHKTDSQQAVSLATLESQQTLGLAQLAAQQQEQSAAIDLQKYQIQKTVQDNQLQRAYESSVQNDQYLLAYHQQNVQADENAYNYTLQYQNNANNSNITQNLIAALTQKAA